MAERVRARYHQRRGQPSAGYRAPLERVGAHLAASAVGAAVRQSMDVPEIARFTFTSEDRARDELHNFNLDGFDSLYPRHAGGRPPVFALAQRREVKQRALSRPVDHDLPFSTWSLVKLADFLVAEGVVDDISHECLRVLLHQEVCLFNA